MRLNRSEKDRHRYLEEQFSVNKEREDEYQIYCRAKTKVKWNV